MADENKVRECPFTFVIPSAQRGSVSSTALIRPGQRSPEWIIASEWHHLGFSFNRDRSGEGSRIDIWVMSGYHWDQVRLGFKIKPLCCPGYLLQRHTCCASCCDAHICAICCMLLFFFRVKMSACACRGQEKKKRGYKFIVAVFYKRLQRIAVSLWFSTGTSRRTQCVCACRIKGNGL